jgi:hypothetical protein
LQLLAAILARWQRLVASKKALNLLYWAICVVLYWHTATAIKMASFFGTFFAIVSFALPLRLLGQYGVSSRPMAASSGFLSSPGHASLGDAVCIAPAHRHGH